MKFGLEEELIMWIMKTSITQIWMVCHLLPFAKVGQYSYQALSSTSKNTPKVCLSRKGEKCGEIARGQFSKITETARLPGWEFTAGKANTYGGYITRHWNWMNSYWNVLNKMPLWSSLGEQFLRFSKNDFLPFHLTFLFFDTSKPSFFPDDLIKEC